MKKKRIAVIGSKGIPSHTSGLEIYVEKLCTAMSDDLDFTVFCRKRYCDKIVKNYKGVNVSHIPSINTKHLDAITYTVFATIVAIIKGYDIFWYHALGPAVTMSLPHMFRKRIVSTVHGLDWKREKFGKLASAVLKFGESRIAKYADEIIVLNRFDQEYFKKRWDRDSNLIHNGVEDPVFKKPEIIKKYGLDGKDYILFMSRIVPEKGLHTLIKAFKMVDIDKKLVIAGKGVHTSDYEEKIHKLVADDQRIIFTGAVDGDEKAELYSNAYAYVLPSTIEGQSIGLLEAMSYGLPCIVSDIPENLDVIGDAGLTFEKESIESLVDTLLRLDKAVRDKKVKETKMYTIHECVENTMGVLLYDDRQHSCNSGLV